MTCIQWSTVTSPNSPLCCLFDSVLLRKAMKLLKEALADPTRVQLTAATIHSYHGLICVVYNNN